MTVSVNRDEPPGPSREQIAYWHPRVWALAWPTIISNLTVPIVAAVDTAMVGHLGDPRLIGAVALGAVLFTFVQWAFSFLRMGTTGFIALAYGARDFTEVNAAALRAIAVALIAGVAVLVLREPIAWVAFELVQGSAGLERLARTYYDIRMWGVPAVLLNMVALGILFGLQQMRLALITQLVLNALNASLDVLFVIGFEWGLAGVAWASVIAEWCAALLGLWFISRQLINLGGRWHDLQLGDRKRLRGLAVANANIFIRTLTVQIAFFYFAANGARQGDVVLAANAILLHLFHFMSYGLDGFAFAVEALAGNAFGGRRARELRAVVLSATAWSGATALMFSIFFWFAGSSLIGLMTNAADVIVVTNTYLPWVIVAPMVSVWCYLLDGVFFGTMHTRDARNSMIVSAAGFACVVWLTPPALENHGLWLAVLTFMTLRGVVLALRYRTIERAAGRATQ